MKMERAQELYSDYAEGTLTPALRQALEQHFEADPAARADYAEFSAVYSLLEQPAGEEVEAPSGFRAKVMERAAARLGQRVTTTSRSGWLGWLVPPARQRATGGALAALAVVVVGGILLTHPGTPGTTTHGELFPNIEAPAVTGLVQSVDMKPGTSFHQFNLHLPSSVPSATVSAYVITATEQITDPSHLSEATSAVSGQHLTNHQGLQIPIAPVDTPPAGSTLNLLAEYKPDAAQPAGAEAVFTPFGAADPAVAAPVNTSFLDGMQAVAAHYGATVIVDVSSAPTQPVTASFSGTDPAAPLADMANAARYTVRKTGDNTYYMSPSS